MNVDELREALAEAKRALGELVPSTIEQLQARLIAELEVNLERERMRLSACGAAALGYSDGSDIHSDYHSASLDDVLALRARCEQAEAEVERLKVCGNCSLYRFDTCGWCGYVEDAEERTESCFHSDACHLSPSRWQPRGGR